MIARSIGLPEMADKGHSTRLGFRLLVLLSVFLLSFGSHAQEVNQKEFQSGAWYQISVPSLASGVSLRSIAPAELESDSYGLEWRMFDWDVVGNAYRQVSLDEPLGVGNGYWFIQLSGDPVVLEIPERAGAPRTEQTAGCPSTAGCVEQIYQIGSDAASWNLFGSPYSSNVPVADFRIAGGQGNEDDCFQSPCTLEEAGLAGVVQNQLYAYDTEIGNYTLLAAGDELPPWQGFWSIATGNADQLQPRLLMPAPGSDVVDPDVEYGAWNKISNYNFGTCLGFDGGEPTVGSLLVSHPCDSPEAVEGRFVRLGDHGYGQVQLGDLCLSVQPENDDLRATVLLDNCGTDEHFQWVPADWRWGQQSVTLRSRQNGLCVARGEGDPQSYVQDLCNPRDDRSQLFSNSFAAGLMAKDKSMTPVDATFHGTLDFNSFHEGTYPMDNWTFGDISFYASPGDVSNGIAREWMAWYSHMDGLHRRVWNQDNFDSVYRANDPNHGSKKVTAVIDEGLCSCGSKQQAEVLGFKNRMLDDPSNWMHHWVMFYEMNRGGPTPNFYARATWPNTHQGGLILPHMMAALAFYEIGGPAGLERDVPGDFSRNLTSWEYEDTPLAELEIPADIQMGILIKILQDQGTGVFIDTLHNMSEKPDATSAPQALCDFRDAVNESTGGTYDERMTVDWRLPTQCF